jgi:hypothetical protein
VSEESGGYTIGALRKHPRLQPLSYGEAQARMIRLGAINSAWASKSGRRGAWILSPAGLEVLVRMRELEADGLAMDAAVDRIKEETSSGTRPALSPESEPSGAPPGPDGHAALIVWLQDLVNDLRAERDRLLGLLERTTPALPPPPQARPRRWWHWRSRSKTPSKTTGA